ncbi:MAG: TonB family protein [Myxococcales bacterium]|nr:TonB family protein [Myxococcales bacterium]
MLLSALALSMSRLSPDDSLPGKRPPLVTLARAVQLGSPQGEAETPSVQSQPKPPEATPEPAPQPQPSKRRPRRPSVQREKVDEIPTPAEPATPAEQPAPSLEPAAASAAGQPVAAGSTTGQPQGAATAGGTDPAATGAGRKAPTRRVEVLPFTDGMTRPKLLSQSAPMYTREARSARVGGLVLAKCVITTKGRLTKCRIIKGLPLMNRAVLDALPKWKYSPVLYRGKAVNVDYLIRLRLVPP